MPSQPRSVPFSLEELLPPENHPEGTVVVPAPVAGMTTMLHLAVRLGDAPPAASKTPAK
jgi:hypothetical protein